MRTPSFPPELTALAETAEAELYYECLMRTPAGTKDALGFGGARISSGVVLSMREDTTNFWSKALGFGADEPVTAELMNEIVAFYQAEGTPAATLQFAPSVLPSDWPLIAGDFGLKGGFDWLKLAAGLHEVRAVGTTPLRVGKVSTQDAEEWARVVQRGFDIPDSQLPIFTAYFENPAFTPFAVWDGDEIVAAANLFVHGQIGSFNTAATLPTHRKLGAQSALITARIQAAYEAGCTWVIAETGKPEPGAVNDSLTNLERAGLRPIYARHNWRWTNTAR
jgi:GNAT superfamily N-acetyltransferase